ncbi:bacteriocin ABC-type exporter, ATP binding/permease protein [Streptococcus acidominimus]|uniref:Bacteriocin ABC-type exporter, ATP binding/permease protein n=2 Tax=Streptococcus acidominimus TaxID=1326 RepID=A0A380IBR2_STRAI|nr:bacteriocin ABC-type exporter, ATP binding/permease protein [Streptococcus acidominimus]
MKRMLGIYRYVSKKYKFLVILGIFMNGGVMLAQPLVMSKILQLGNGDLSFEKIWQLLVYGLSVYLVIYSLMLFANHTHNIFRREIHIGIRSSLFRKLIANSRHSQNDKITLLTQDMELLGDRYLEPIAGFLCWAFVSLVTALYILMQDFLLGSIFVVCTILRPIPQFLMNRRLKDTGKEYSDFRTKVHEEVSDSINGSETLIANQSLENNFQRVSHVVKEYQEAIQRYSFTHNIVFFYNGFMEFFSQILPVAIGFYLMMNGGTVTIANLLTMFIAANRLAGPIQNLMYQAEGIQGAQAIADKIFGILETQPDFVEVKEHYLTNLDLLTVESLVKFYGDKQVLSGLNLSIKMGEKVLIKGASGSGKTTLFRLLSGQEKADAGLLYVTDKTGYQTEDFRANIGIISQHPFLFNDTIRYNLALGDDFSDEILLKVLGQVGLLNEFTDILNVKVNNNGENISGGQRVRLEIARFLLRKKDILLADEVTAALDEKNGKAVRQLLHSLPIMIVEIAHHIDDDIRYNQVLELKRGEEI